MDLCDANATQMRQTAKLSEHDRENGYKHENYIYANNDFVHF